MEIGKFQLGVHSPDSLTGFILGYPHEITFERQANGGQVTKEGKTLPTYKAFVRQGEIEIPVGAAWEKPKKDGLSCYEAELTLGLLFPKKIYANLMPSMSEGGICKLFWDTPEEKAAYRAKQAQTAKAHPLNIA
ncbi:MAG: DUF736 family protein [Alphaproteobacteria bacterium]